MSLQSNPDPGRTLGQFGLAVVALVLVAAGLFWAIDMVSGDPDPVGAPTEPVASSTATAAPSAATTPTPTPTDATVTEPTATEPTATEPTATEPTADETTAAPTEEPPSETASVSEPAPTEDATSDKPTETETETGDATTGVDRADTSLQVLDGIKDGSGRARDIADGLVDDGYDLVAFNTSSIVYDTTTVFWTEGHEEEAQALAADNGWDEIVFNVILSDSVDVHVVVGTDEQE